MKKILALVLALAMVAMVGLALADSTITVTTQTPTGAASDVRTYVYYKIFSSEIASGGAANGVTYYLASPGEDAKKTALESLFNFTKSADGSRWIVTGVAGSPTDEGLSESLKGVVEASGSPFSASASFAANAEQTVSDGYYLIVSSLGTKMILDTFETQTVQEKNSYPGPDKKIIENNTATTQNDVSIGDIVNYQVTVTVPDTAAEKEIVVTDKMYRGLTLDTSSLQMNGAETTLAFAAAGTDGDYNLYTITIPASMVVAARNSTITFTYSARLNANALIDGENPNTVRITYDNFTSQDVTVITKTYDVSIKKTDGTTHGDLTGAEFVLYKSYNSETKTGTDPISFVAIDGGYRVAAAGETGSTTISAGKIELKGLDAGNYYLVETKAPDGGYNLLEGATTITVSSSTGKTGDGDEAVYDYDVQNFKGTELPHTGGIGTTIFYILGGLLVVGAAVILVARRKAHE